MPRGETTAADAAHRGSDDGERIARGAAPSRQPPSAAGRRRARPLVWLRAGAALLLLSAAWLLLGLPALGLLQTARVAPAGPATGHPASDLRRVGELWHLHLAGGPAMRGWDNGRLCAPLIAGLERELHRQLVELVPGFAGRHLLLGGLGLVQGDLEARLRPEQRAEIAGLARGYRAAGDPHAALGPAYGRLLGYHALHDASQNLIDNPLVNAPPVGCTAVAVAGPRALDGHLLVGRLFDFEGGRRFDTHKVVRTVAPATGHAYLSVDWGGVCGAVTGLNATGLWVSVNAATSDGRVWRGRPLVVVVQEILQHCDTIAAAVERLDAAELAVSEAVLVASAREGRAVVVEVGPTGLALREMHESTLAVTNHFLASAWAGDAATRRRRERGTSASRLARARELLALRERHAPADLLALLRDRAGPAGLDLGFGNRGTINAWIGAHLVVADLDAGLVWVCESPHGLGVARAFDVHGPRPDVPALPSAVDLHRQRTRHAAWSAARAHAREALAAGRTGRAGRAADRMRSLNPRHFEGHWLLGLCREGDRRRALLETALALRPGYAADRERIRAALAETVP